MKALILTTVLSFLPVEEELQPTPAELRIERALASVSAHPDQPRGYNELAFALARRARETADSSYYERALSAVEVSLKIAPSNHEARKQKAWILLGQHRFAEALELAAELNRDFPDDVLIYGYLTDAHVELGNYSAAESACQWMLDLRPGNVPGLTRAAYLRELFGDPEGALELMAQAFHRTSQRETEDRAWILTHIAQLNRSLGRSELAAEIAADALELFPGYHYAQAELAAAHMDQGEPRRAAELLRVRYASAPHPENLYDLAVALQAAGATEEARECFARFEREALAESDSVDNANLQLVFYYTDHAERADAAEQALEIARKEIARRTDVFTRDAHAWALHANGCHAEALEEVEAVLAVGIRDRALLSRAEAIAAAGVELEAGR